MSVNRRQWRIGIAGLGTVGAGLVECLVRRPSFAPTGESVTITGISARSRSRPRPVDVTPFAWFDDPVVLARSDEIDLFVELIGGSDGPAKVSVEAALDAGKPVVTANKALIAEHGAELAVLAERRGAPLLFEAAVMGGTPAVKMLREAMVGDEVTGLAGILNGTCNFILSEMEASGRPFADVLAEAQRAGYAEADPTMDIGGFDAAHKITILAALAFGCAPHIAAAQIEGIAGVELIDIRLAGAIGYRIKLVASAFRSEAGVAIQVHPALIPLEHPLARAAGVLNALFIEGEKVGRIFIQGRGAGAGPTAAAVAADIADVMAGAVRPVFQRPAADLQRAPAPDAAHSVLKAYLRLLVRDEPGVIAAVSETLAEAGVSIDNFLQRPMEGQPGVPIVLTTHSVAESALNLAVARIAGLAALIEPPRRIRIAPI